MKKIFLILLMGSITASFAAEKPLSTPTDMPVGYWKTMNELTGKPSSIVQIYSNPDHLLMAKIVKLFPNKDNQTMLGKVIISNLKWLDHQGTHGEILNSINGKTYHCSAHLTKNGNKLNIQEFLGFPLFGHSQTWERVDLMSG